MVRFKLVLGELALQRTDVFHVDVGGHRVSSYSGGLFEHRITVHSGEQMSNNTRANLGIFSGKFASLPERLDDFVIDKFSEGDKGLLAIPVGARIT